ncbi:MAG: MBL fold metallo-hydrolase [Chloroflexota bacterium]|nr:MBL fold metallo-hydrolase [Chloroflexota bacterium]
MPTPRYQDDNIIIHKMECGPYANNMYLVVCPQTNESILIDTPADPEPMIELAKTTDVKAIIITHNHIDHLLGFDAVTSAIDAPVGISTEDADELPRPADRLIRDGDVISAGKVNLTAMLTPGHTAGSACFYTPGHLFAGDTLFPGGPGKTWSPESFQEIIESITTKLFKLDDDDTVFPGHGGDETDVKTAKAEYADFASREHPDDIFGDVLWKDA